jgi:hypothetical protein
VDVHVVVRDNDGYRLEEDFSFAIESQFRQEADIRSLEPGDPDLNDPEYDYDTGIQLNSGWLAGAKVIYNSSQPMPHFLTTQAAAAGDMTTVGEALMVLPPTIFSTPAKIILPVRQDDYSVNDATIYMYTGSEWVPAIGPSGSVKDGGYGWAVPGSRVNKRNENPPVVEIKVYHTAGIFAGASLSEDSTEEDSSPSGKAEASCFVETLISEYLNH